MKNTKCPWCLSHALLEKYHDEEWGVPVHDDRKLFEYLLMEWMSCGLSWLLMLKKRKTFAACFCGFDYRAVARLDEAAIDRILKHPDMIRSRRKVAASVHNARCYEKIVGEFGSFDRYIRGFTGGRTVVHRRRLEGEWLTRSELSDTIAADLKRRGFKFLGSILIYSYMQGIGLVNDHEPDCACYRRNEAEAILP